MTKLLILLLAFPTLCLAKSSVSWKTSKRMFLVSEQKPVGINSAIEVQTGFDNTRYIKLLIPIKHFTSGEAERDQEVAKILKANIQPTLVFQTRILNANQYEDLLRGQVDTLLGTLTIAKENHPIEIKITISDGVLIGTFKGTFSQFGIAPPVVAGGLVAKVRDELELAAKIDFAELR